MGEPDLSPLDERIAMLRGLPALGPAAMPSIAQQLGDAVRADLSAGRDPETGEAWAPTKKGEQAMQGAAGALQVVVSGNVVVLQIGKPYVFWHYGVRGALPRHCVPVGSLPDKLGNAVRLGFVEPWRQATGAR